MDLTTQQHQWLQHMGHHTSCSSRASSGESYDLIVHTLDTIGCTIHSTAYPGDLALLILTYWSVAEEHLAGLAEWQEPQAGMFAWLKLSGGIKDADEILDKLKEEKVVVVPGSIPCRPQCVCGLLVCLCVHLTVAVGALLFG
jgi:hypothetical protein